MTGPVGTTSGATGKALGVAPQLPGRKRSRKKYCGDDRRQKSVLDGLSHHKIAFPSSV